MTKKNIWIAITFIFLFGALSTAYAESGSPLVYGTINAAAVSEKAGDDWHFDAKEVAFGIRGMYKFEDIDWLKIPYRVEVEVTKAVNNSGGENDIEVKNAVIALATSYGTIVIAPRGESGHQRQLYGAVDLFERYEANRLGGLFDQPDEASGVLAYGTPKFLGGASIWFATLNLGDNGDDNDENVDAYATRIFYDNKKLSAGLGYVSISDKVVPTNDYSRIAATFKYKIDGGHQIGATYEVIEDHPAYGDWNTLGIVARANLPADFDVALGYYHQNGDRDNSSIVANLRYHLNKRTYCYAEYAAFDKENPDLSYVAIGFKIGFRGKPF